LRLCDRSVRDVRPAASAMRSPRHAARAVLWEIQRRNTGFKVRRGSAEVGQSACLRSSTLSWRFGTASFWYHGRPSGGICETGLTAGLDQAVVQLRLRVANKEAGPGVAADAIKSFEEQPAGDAWAQNCGESRQVNSFGPISWLPYRMSSNPRRKHRESRLSASEGTLGCTAPKPCKHRQLSWFATFGITREMGAHRTPYAAGTRADSETDLG